MSENVSRVIPPNNANTIDYDFLAFSFNGRHSWDDFNIYRVIGGDRYTDELAPQMTDRTGEIPGTDGMLFFGSNHKSKVFNINIAFEGLTEEKLRAMKQWLNGKEMGDLWFDECPYKVYTAKVTGSATIKYIAFEKDGERIYNGEGTIQFTAYWPYAHTPDYIGDTETLNGKEFSNYSTLFKNAEQWAVSSGLATLDEDGVYQNAFLNICTGENPGDIPAPFILTYEDTIEEDESLTFTVGDCSITVGGEGQSALSNIVWDSKTGMVSAKVGTSVDQVPIAYSGNSLGAIPVGGLNSDEIELNGATLKYHYWYY